MNDWQTSAMLEMHRLRVQREARNTRLVEEVSGRTIAPTSFDRLLASMGRWMEKTGQRLQERAISPVPLSPALGRHKG